jgi:hypothetical protein
MERAFGPFGAGQVMVVVRARSSRAPSGRRGVGVRNPGRSPMHVTLGPKALSIPA